MKKEIEKLHKLIQRAKKQVDLGVLAKFDDDMAIVDELSKIDIYAIEDGR